MPYQATVIPVMIASPGDVLEERNVTRDVIHEWNYVNSMSTNAVLMPVGWETHSVPELGTRPQQLINEHVLKDCDLLVGIFWTRLGTPTGKSASGTVEEIERHIEAGKPAMVYFSDAPVAPESMDSEQYAALKEFKNWCRDIGLIETYDNVMDFQRKFTRHLSLKLKQNQYLIDILKSGNASPGNGASATPSILATPTTPAAGSLGLSLSEEAKQLLLEASLDKSGVIINAAHIGGRTLQTNSKTFGDSGDRRSMARWEYALEQLMNHDLVVDRSYKGEVFEVAELGYQVADELRATQS